jgi:hypothetical protein
MNLATIVIFQPIDSLHIFEFKVVSEIGYLFIVGKSFSDDRDDDSFELVDELGKLVNWKNFKIGRNMNVENENTEE